MTSEIPCVDRSIPVWAPTHYIVHRRRARPPSASLPVLGSAHPTRSTSSEHIDSSGVPRIAFLFAELCAHKIGVNRRLWSVNEANVKTGCCTTQSHYAAATASTQMTPTSACSSYPEPPTSLSVFRHSISNVASRHRPSD